MAVVKVLFFGVLTEVTGISEESLSVNTLDELKLVVFKKYLMLQQYNFVVSLNQKLINTNVDLKDGDELAFLPPFAGG
jgi:sulfur-carrier protein